MTRVLLHICCGACAIEPFGWLRGQGYEVVGLFYNPNIHPLQEYLRRRLALAQVAERLALDVQYLDQEYAPQDFFRAVNGREEERCGPCYALRLKRTAAAARALGCEIFTTTLLYSKYQQHAAIAAHGVSLAAGGGPRFLYHDFRVSWKQGIEKSKAWGIYRQQYCGCLYSEFERYSKDLERCVSSGAATQAIGKDT